MPQFIIYASIFYESILLRWNIKDAISFVRFYHTTKMHK